MGLGDKTIEKDYVLTWVPLAIANSPLRDQLAFKGGTVIKKIYESNYRFSEDLDFTLLTDISNEILITEIESLFLYQLSIRSTRMKYLYTTGADSTCMG